MVQSAKSLKSFVRTVRCTAPAVLAAVVLNTSAAVAQSVPRPPEDTNKTFFVRRDLALTGVAIVGTVLISHFDKRIANWTQSASVQGSSSRHRLVNDLTKVNETTLTGAAILSYAIGRLSHSKPWPTSRCTPRRRPS